jgi:hypothetical protein
MRSFKRVRSPSCRADRWPHHEQAALVKWSLFDRLVDLDNVEVLKKPANQNVYGQSCRQRRRC